MKNIAIIPARSGSKGIKDKNIRLMNNKPLLAYSIEAAKESGLFDVIFVSTDSEEYAEIAKKYGAEVPFLRNEQLATDNVSTWEAVKETLLNYRVMGKTFDTLTLLQPTSPLRTAEDIRKGYEMMKKLNANTIVGVCETDHSPLWCNTLPKDNSLSNFINRQLQTVPRQGLPKYYRINGALYILKTDYFNSTNDIYAQKSFAFIMDKLHSVDIDDEMDFIFAEILVRGDGSSVLIQENRP
ncbi:MAG: acylneuraminate cytidylyltransferase family protein [Saccharofermentanales bacterium]